MNFDRWCHWCAPAALGIALGETYEQACVRIRQQGIEPRSVPGPALHKIIRATGRLIMTAHPDTQTQTSWQLWRELHKQGLWLVATVAPCASGSHLMCLRDGKAYDNGWGICEQGCMDVVAAWRLS